MADTPEASATADAAAAPAKRKVGVETVLAVAGALAVIGFFLPWLDLPGDGGRVSGLDVARSGGIWVGVVAIPALGLITAVLGGLRWSVSRYAGLLTAVAMLVPVAYLLVTNWPWLYTIPLAMGIAAIVLGTLARGPWLNIPLGAALVVLSVVGPLVAGDEPLFEFGDDTKAAVDKDASKGESEGKAKSESESEGESKATSESESESESESKSKSKSKSEATSESEGESKATSESESESESKSESKSKATSESEGGSPMGAIDAPILTLGVGLGVVKGLGVVPAIPLLALFLLIPFCGVWLLWSGLRKKGRERPLVVTGWSIIALDAYVAALVAFGPTLVTGGIGLWMTALGGCVLLLVSRPFKHRSKHKKSKPAKDAAPKVDKKAAKAQAKADKAAAKADKAAAKAASKTDDKNGAAKDDDTAKAKAKAKAKAEPAKAADPEAEKLAKIAKLKQLKARKLAMEKAKEEEKAEEAANKKAAKTEAETAKAGAKLAAEPEPVFAADPTAPAAPENEGREALMQRMGVKKPPPPTDAELEDMLAALKKRASDSDD